MHRSTAALSYLDYVRQRRRVTFKRLEEPKEDGFVLELRQESSYDEVSMCVVLFRGGRAWRRASAAMICERI